MLGRDFSAPRHAGHDVVGFAAPNSTWRTPKPDWQARPRAAGVVINCAAWTDVDGAEEAGRRPAVNGDRGRNVAAAAAEVGASIVYLSSDYVFDGTKGAPYIESDQPAPLSVYGQAKAPARRRPRRPTSATTWFAGLARRDGGRDSSRRCWRSGDRNEVVVVRDQVGSPTYTAHLAYALVRLIDTTAFGIHHIAGGGECSWYEFAEEIFEQAKVECRVLSVDDRDARPPGAAPAVLGPGQPARARDRAARLAGRPGRLPRPARRAEEASGMKLLVTGAAGFIGSTYVRAGSATSTRCGVLDKLTYAGRRENLPEGDRARSRARSRTRRSCARRWRAATRSSTSPPSRTSTARSTTRTPSPAPT